MGIARERYYLLPHIHPTVIVGLLYILPPDRRPKQNNPKHGGALQAPPGRGLRRPQLRRVRETLAGHYYERLSGHAAAGTHRFQIRDDRHERVLVVRRTDLIIVVHHLPGTDRLFGL